VYVSPALKRPQGLVSRLARRLPPLVACATLLSATTLLPAIARADDQDAIDYRQHVMKTLGDQMTLINQILQKKAPPDDLGTFTQVLAIAATTAKSAFMPDVAGGKSKPDVWTHWADFSKQLDALVASTDDLAKAVRAGGLTAAASKVGALNCMSCHNTYMQK
jgi:cytochrome c556